MWKIEIIEQIGAVAVTAILVMANFFLFTPWRNGQDPRNQKTQTSTRNEVSGNTDREPPKSAGCHKAAPVTSIQPNGTSSSHGTRANTSELNSKTTLFH